MPVVIIQLHCTFKTSESFSEFFEPTYGALVWSLHCMVRYKVFCLFVCFSVRITMIQKGQVILRELMLVGAPCLNAHWKTFLCGVGGMKSPVWNGWCFLSVKATPLWAA